MQTAASEAATALPEHLPRPLGADELAAYRNDGAAVIRGIVPMAWIERMRAAVDRILASPTQHAIEYTPAGRPGRYLGDMFVWRQDADFRAFAFDSPLPELARALMDAHRVTLFYDQLLCKEPGTAEPTPLHQDLPYWPVRGEHIVSIWVPFDPVRFDSGTVEYLRGSHRWGKMYRPQNFGTAAGTQNIYDSGGMEPMPPAEELLAGQTLLRWELEPGDVIVHHPLALHFSQGNGRRDLRRRALALRYLGDDARFDARPGTFMEGPKVKPFMPADCYPLPDGAPMDNALFPRVWPRVWPRV